MKPSIIVAVLLVFVYAIWSYGYELYEQEQAVEHFSSYGLGGTK